MDLVAGLLKLAHVALAMILVAGLIGRWITLRRAERATDVAAFADRAVRGGRTYEVVAIALIVALMVLKPF